MNKELFIGRRYELDFLQSKYQDNAAQLIVVYGRRRIGKTEMLNESGCVGYAFYGVFKGNEYGK